MLLGNAVFKVCLFSFRARRDDAAWPLHAKRSNAAMDENGRAMDIAFPGIMGIHTLNIDNDTSDMTRNILIILFLLMPHPIKADVLNMRLINITGVEEAMSNYIGNGKWVVVNIWSPTCSACVTELPQIKKFIARNPDVPVLGVTLDFPSFAYGKIDIIKDFVSRNPLDYPLFLADMDQTAQLIGRWLVGIPSIAIFHPDGRPLVTWPGVVEIDEIEKFIMHYKEGVDPLTDGFE